MPTTPFVFRVDFTSLGKGTMRVVFGGFEPRADAPRLLLDTMSFGKRPDVRNPRPWVDGGLCVGFGAAALAVGHRRRQPPGA
ncbi:hypothetical protein [Nakamurella panacisegetis]|nr:hypothetical protein [Nakamurella panacisegetis]